MPMKLNRTYWKSPRSASPLSLVTSCDGLASPIGASAFDSAWPVAAYLARTAAANGPPRSSRYSSWSDGQVRSAPRINATTADRSPQAIRNVQATTTAFDVDVRLSLPTRSAPSQLRRTRRVPMPAAAASGTTSPRLTFLVVSPSAYE